MLKMFKYLFLANLFKKAKKNIVIAASMLLLLMISTFLMNDLLAVASGSDKYLFLLIKWVLILLFIAITVYNLLKVFNTATESVGIKPKSEAVVVTDAKKERILAKEHLQTKSDRIMKKYMKKATV